eukprot:11317939-Karenia_brevis.AAC.1
MLMKELRYWDGRLSLLGLLGQRAFITWMGVGSPHIGLGPMGSMGPRGNGSGQPLREHPHLPTLTE